MPRPNMTIYQPCRDTRGHEEVSFADFQRDFFEAIVFPENSWLCCLTWSPLQMPNMQTAASVIKRDGCMLLTATVEGESIGRLRDVFQNVLAAETRSELARSSRGHVYAVRNLIDSVPEVLEVWQTGPMANLLHSQLGDTFGLFRALFFDKPPERTWSLPKNRQAY